MSHYIPVFYFPIERAELPDNLDDSESALDLIATRWESPAESRLRSTTSRNWWHQQVLLELSNGLAVEGLEFVTSQVTCLDATELVRADQALGTLLETIGHGIPDLGEHEPEHGGLWWIRQYTGNDEAFAAVLHTAQPSLDASSSKDGGLEAVEAFCSFVKSLREAMGDALAQGKCLLYVQLQP
jgi:hypothetical protein